MQRIYAFANGYKLSAINATIAHSYSYAWEFAVIAPDGSIDYTTELTSDVYVTSTDDEANAFIERAATVLGVNNDTK